jgi:predicted Zn-dependent protease
MAKLGYDPKAMLSMLGIMKDYESVQKKQAKGRGAVRPTYHGVFASHPRNDARLRTVVVKADALKSNLNKGDGAETYRQLTDGLVWGVNFLAKTAPPNRYSNMDLKVRIDFPTTWSVNSAIEDGLATAEAPDKVASMTLKRARRTAQAPEEYLFNYMKIQQLTDGQAISPAGLSGYTGLLPATAEKPSQRIAVIYYKLDAYIISADVTDSDQYDDLDQAMLSAIRTFRPISRAEIAGQKPKIVKYLQIESSTTYAGLIKTYKLNASDEEILRVINGHYPVGEPKVGQWIKVFQQ